MALIDLISEDIVKVPLESKTKPEIIRELLQILVKAKKITDADFGEVLEAIKLREAKGSTGLDHGIAVPHAKCAQLKELTMAIGISPGGVDFDSIDKKPSYLFFMLLAAKDQTGPHIEALSEIARITQSQQFLQSLIEAKSAKEVVGLFKVD